MTSMEIPMEFVVGRYMRACDIEWAPCSVERLKGTVCHSTDNVGITSCHSRLYLVKVLLCSGRQDTSHLLAHLLHFLSAKRGTSKFAASTGGRNLPEIVSVNTSVAILSGHCVYTGSWRRRLVRVEQFWHSNRLIEQEKVLQGFPQTLLRFFG